MLPSTLANPVTATSWPWGQQPEFDLPILPPSRRDLHEIFPALVRDYGASLPLPGAGGTMARFAALAEVSARDLSLGRLFEGHTDAVAILAEAGHPGPFAVAEAGHPGPPRAIEGPQPAVLAVWAARRGDADVVATCQPGGGWRLHGRKPWASGAATVTHALVTAATPGGDALFLIPARGAGVVVVPGTWPAVGMAMSDSRDVDIDLAVGADALVGPPGWYVTRPGFWFGAIGVAACWLGGAVGLVRALRQDLADRRPDAHQLAHLGAAAARCASLARDLQWAADRIDADPGDRARAMRLVALEVRHLVEQGCLEVLTDVGRAGGAGPWCHDPDQSRRAADLPVYIRQHHAERDAEALGRAQLPPDA